jgi:hypothetical protein
MVLRLCETADEVADLQRLQGIIALLRDCPGPDPFELEVVNGEGEPIRLQLDGLSTVDASRLREALALILDEGALEVWVSHGSASG